MITIAAITTILFIGAICIIFKAGATEGICKYDYEEK